jgi:hypothetical protein
MKQALSEERSPLDACLESVLPGVHQWHHANQAAVALVSNDVKSMHNDMNMGFSHVFEELRETRRSRLAQEKSFATLLDMGRRVLLTGESIEYNASLLSPSTDVTQETPDPTTIFGTPSDNPALQPCDKQPTIDEHKKYTMKPKHSSLVDLLSEWIGIGDFQDDLVELRDVTSSLVHHGGSICLPTHIREPSALLEALESLRNRIDWRNLMPVDSYKMFMKNNAAL